MSPGKIGTAPPRSAWPTRVRSQRVPGWTVATIDGSGLIPHDASAGVFASRAGAQRFSKGRRSMQPANTGSCFRAEWPETVRELARGPADLEPLLIPEPHARRTWSGGVGWTEGAVWLEAGPDGRWIRLELRQGWVQISPPRFGGFSDPYEVQFERVGHLESQGERFSVFGLREDDRMHLLTVPEAEDGTLVTRSPPLDDDRYRRSMPCAWQRLVVDREPRHHLIRSASRPGRVWRISARPGTRDDVAGVELELILLATGNTP